MRTVDLPLMTPTRSREDDSRRPSLPGPGRQEFTATQGVLLQFDRPERDRLSGSTTVDEVADTSLDVVEGLIKDSDEVDEVDIPLETEEDVKEARINRKAGRSTFSVLIDFTMLMIPDC